MFMNSKQSSDFNSFLNNESFPSLLQDFINNLPEISEYNALELIECFQKYASSSDNYSKIILQIRISLGSNVLLQLSNLLINHYNVSEDYLLSLGIYEINKTTFIPSFNENKLQTPITKKRNLWSKEESNYLKDIIENYTINNTKYTWRSVASHINNKFHSNKSPISTRQHYYRVICANSSTWTMEDEKLLLKHCNKYGSCNWRIIGKIIDKTDTQCHYYYNKYYNRPNIELTQEEIKHITNYCELNYSWYKTAQLLNGERKKIHQTPLQYYKNYKKQTKKK